MPEDIRRIRSHDVILPTATHAEPRLRRITRPDPARAAPVDRLGIVLPERVRPAEPGQIDLALGT